MSLLTERSGAIARLTFNRPEKFNALDLSMAKAFAAAVADLAQDPDLRAVVLTGAGPAFMAGGDVECFAADLDRADAVLNELLDHMHPAILALRQIDAPVIAAVNGAAAGAGLSLVLAADYVIAHPAAKFVLAYDKLAVTPDCGGSWFMSRRMGRAAAAELMFMGRTLTAEEARSAGIVNRVSSEDGFHTVVEEVAARIAQGPTKAFGHFKRLTEADLPLAAQLEAERAAFVAATATQDFQSAVTAFTTKNKPTYSGQ